MVYFLLLGAIGMFVVVAIANASKRLSVPILVICSIAVAQVWAWSFFASIYLREALAGATLAFVAIWVVSSRRKDIEPIQTTIVKYTFHQVTR